MKIGIDKKFKAHWRNYIFQSLLATLVIFIVLLVLPLRYAVTIASIGSTAFIVFAMPRHSIARSNKIIGGYLIGILSGSVFALIPTTAIIHPALGYSLAVGLSIFLMVITDTEHPPASGVALGIAIGGFSVYVVLAAMISAVILSAVHYLMGKRLKDLV